MRLHDAIVDYLGAKGEPVSATDISAATGRTLREVSVALVNMRNDRIVEKAAGKKWHLRDGHERTENDLDGIDDTAAEQTAEQFKRLLPNRPKRRPVPERKPPGNGEDHDRTQTRARIIALWELGAGTKSVMNQLGISKATVAHHRKSVRDEILAYDERYKSGDIPPLEQWTYSEKLRKAVGLPVATQEPIKQSEEAAIEREQRMEIKPTKVICFGDDVEDAKKIIGAIESEHPESNSVRDILERNAQAAQQAIDDYCMAMCEGDVLQALMRARDAARDALEALGDA